MAPTLYVHTFYKGNHAAEGYRQRPIDPRFLDSDRNLVYFLIDDEVPPALEGRRILQERELDPKYKAAGARHLSEWAFLLAEADEGFCEYPMFMTSSRFYEKNTLLRTDLNREWDALFARLEEYGWGFLPSYDRPLTWVPFRWVMRDRPLPWWPFSPFTADAFEPVRRHYGIRIPEDYAAFADLQCNYIGFQSREHLVRYIGFYRPLIDEFFDERLQPLKDFSPIVRSGSSPLRNEKPFTFYLEYLSHLFFRAEDLPFFALHYDGYHEVDERARTLRKLEDHLPSLREEPQWRARFVWRRLLPPGTLTWGLKPYLPEPVVDGLRQARRAARGVTGVR